MKGLGMQKVSPGRSSWLKTEWTTTHVSCGHISSVIVHVIFFPHDFLTHWFTTNVTWCLSHGRVTNRCVCVCRYWMGHVHCVLLHRRLLQHDHRLDSLLPGGVLPERRAMERLQQPLEHSWWVMVCGGSWPATDSLSYLTLSSALPSVPTDSPLTLSTRFVYPPPHSRSQQITCPTSALFDEGFCNRTHPIFTQTTIFKNGFVPVVILFGECMVQRHKYVKSIQTCGMCTSSK